MPFRSAKQERFMFANHPEIAQRWLREYGSTPVPKAKKKSKKRKKK